MWESDQADDMGHINPYNVNKPINPKYFSDRDELLSAFRRSVIAVNRSKGITSPINIAITGSWGMGKTSAQLKFRDMLKTPGKDINVFTAIVHLSPECCKSSDIFFRTIMEGVFREYDSTTELPQKLRDFIGEELSKWEIKKLSMSPEIEKKDAPPLRGIDFRHTMKTFWDKLHASGVQMAVIMLDDIQYALAPDGNADLLIDLRTDMQALAAAGTRYMFIITGPSSIYPEVRDRAEPFTRLFERFDLGPFDIEGTRQLIHVPLNAEGIDLAIDDDVIERIHEITGGHPYFITLTMREVLSRVKKNHLTLMDFESIYPAIIEQFARFRFSDDLARASGAEKQLLIQIAAADNIEISPSDFKGSGTSRLLDRLVKKSLMVKSSRGKYRIYNPLFREYLRNVGPGADDT